MSRRNRPPADPQLLALTRQRARDDAANDSSRLALPANTNVRVATDARGKRFAAFRSDVFDLLKGRGSLTDAQHAATRRLQEAVATAAGVGGAGPTLEVIDGANGDREQVNGRMMKAAEEVADVLTRIPRRSRALLMGLVEPLVVEGRTICWRGIVERLHQVTDRAVQTDRVVCACEDLVTAYRARDNEPRRVA